MPRSPSTESLKRESPTAILADNIQILSTLMRVPADEDVTLRPFAVWQYDAYLIFIEGLTDSNAMSETILRPCLHAAPPPADLPPDALASYIQTHILTTTQLKAATTFGELVLYLLDGLCILMIDQCATPLVMDIRDMPKRSVSHTNNESVVLGSQEGFIESLRTNISLVRKNLRSEALVTEMITVGKSYPSNIALLSMEGVTDPQSLSEVRRRLKCIDRDHVSGTGQLQQLIEDNHWSLFPQLLQTERPDRVAAGLSEGQFALLMDNAPYALLAPVTAFHFLHASDDTFMRWQYGTFIRLIRALGIMISLLLPGVYAAVTQYHAHLLPMDLLTSIAEARANVPFPVLTEVLIMEFSFYLINEAGTRIPSQIGSALGIVGALILGQTAVSASIISPILIIIVALTGLGNFVVPSYNFGLGIELYRLMILLAGAAYGLYGIILACFAIGAGLCGMRSFGAPFFAPAAPWRKHNPDLLLRLPLWLQKRRMFYAEPRQGKR